MENPEYTIDINGKRFKLNEDIRNALQERAESAYSENPTFSCWWQIAREENYTDEAWAENIHEEGDPVLVIETDGPMVPWDKLDQLEATMPQQVDPSHDAEFVDEREDVDSGSGMKSIPPEEKKTTRSSKDIFGRTHFALTPHRYEEVPSPGGDEPDKIPPKPEEIDGEMMVMWLPRHPDIEHTWGTGEAMVSMSSWVEWNVQQRANQPKPDAEKENSHDSFESLCQIHDCEVIGEYTPSNDIPEGISGSVERKGEKAFEDGRFGGGNWDM
jgi:hypothetical protein